MGAGYRTQAIPSGRCLVTISARWIDDLGPALHRQPTTPDFEAPHRFAFPPRLTPFTSWRGSARSTEVSAAKCVTDGSTDPFEIIRVECPDLFGEQRLGNGVETIAIDR